MTIDTTDLIKALEERKRQLSKWTDKDRAKERIDEIDCIIDTDVPYLVKEESEKPVLADLEEAAEEYLQKVKDGFLRTLEHPTAKDCFKDGAKWQYQKDRGIFAQIKAKTWSEGFDACKEQIMKEAVEGELFDFWDIKDVEHCIASIDLATTIGFNDGDKVRVIVLPKED